jgi:uncharacterized DUF497 family protein
VFVWDETKRISNLKKHGLDFRDAHLVYDNPNKITYDASRHNEYRLMDIALLVLRGKLLTLVYMDIGEDVRVISFRNCFARGATKPMNKIATRRPLWSVRPIGSVCSRTSEGDAIPYRAGGWPIRPE